MKGLLVAVALAAAAVLSGAQVCDVVYTKLPKQHSWQGMALWGDWLLSFEDGGYCRVYDRSGDTLRHEADFTIASADPANHCNQANLGVEQLPGSEMPVVYLTVGKPGSPLDMRCHVESIERSGRKWSSRLVQTIELDTTGWYAAGLNTIFGAPSWLIDRDKKSIWVFSAKLRTLPSTTPSFDMNHYVATKFRLPAIAEGEFVRFTVDDVLDQAVFEMDVYATQSGCIHDGKIYYSFGFGHHKTPLTHSKVRVYDLDKRCIAARIELDSLIPEECEAVAIDGDRMLINTNSRLIYGVPLP